MKKTFSGGRLVDVREEHGNAESFALGFAFEQGRLAPGIVAPIAQVLGERFWRSAARRRCVRLHRLVRLPFSLKEFLVFVNTTSISMSAS